MTAAKKHYWHSSGRSWLKQLRLCTRERKNLGVGPFYRKPVSVPILISAIFNLTKDDLQKIEEKMSELSNRDVPFTREEKKWEDAVEYFKKKRRSIQLKLLASLKVKPISFYHQGNFTDLCRGPAPALNRKDKKPIKLLNVGSPSLARERKK